MLKNIYCLYQYQLIPFISNTIKCCIYVKTRVSQTMMLHKLTFGMSSSLRTKLVVLVRCDQCFVNKSENLFHAVKIVFITLFF
jgi:hypothetical protein